MAYCHMDFAIKWCNQADELHKSLFQLTRRALFPGDSEIDQLYKIFKAFGTPTDEIWPGVSKLPDHKRSFPSWKPHSIAELVSCPSPEAEQFLEVIFNITVYFIYILNLTVFFFGPDIVLTIILDIHDVYLKTNHFKYFKNDNCYKKIDETSQFLFLSGNVLPDKRKSKLTSHQKQPQNGTFLLKIST